MELKQYRQNDLEHAEITAGCSAFVVYGCCGDDEPAFYVLYEEIEQVKKEA